MALPFRRPTRPPSGGDDGPTICSFPSPIWRTWAVTAMLSTLSPLVREALFAWLLEPTDLYRWPPPTTFSRRRVPFQPKETCDQPRSVARRLLRQELRVIRQTLGFPPEAMSGLTRNGLLIVHAIRLRQLEGWLQPARAAQEIKRLIA